MNALLQHLESRFKNLHIAAEFVDDDALHAGAFLVRQQHHSAQQRREHAPQVDVAHQQHRRIGGFRHRHIHDVPGTQVDFRRTARPLNDYAVHGGFQRVIRRLDAFAQGRLVAVILHRSHCADGFAVHNYLTAAIARGFEQHGIHAHIRFNTCRLRLRHLRTPHFQAVLGDERI